MFGLFGTAVPIDKEALKFCAAFALLKRTEELALDALDDEKRKAGDVAAREVSEKDRPKVHEEIDKTHNMKRAEIKKAFVKREIKLFRRAAGPLAKIVEG